MEAIDPFVFRLSIFVLAIFVGYFVVWSVTPALHTPLMSVTNAISSVIVVGALIAVSVQLLQPATLTIAVDRNEVVSVDGQSVPAAAVPTRIHEFAAEHRAPSPAAVWTSKILGFVALILASVNIFGGFLVTARMLAMYKKKDGAPAKAGHK